MADITGDSDVPFLFVTLCNDGDDTGDVGIMTRDCSGKQYDVNALY